MLDRDGDFNFAVLCTPLPALLTGLMLVIEVGMGPDMSIPLVAILVMVTVAYIGAAAYFLHEQMEEDRFRTWLMLSIPEIESGSARWGDILVNPQTELRLFEIPVAMIALSYNVQLRPRFAQGEPLKSIRALSTAITLLIGWWSWLGPFLTPICAFRNARGGQSITVAEYHQMLVGSGTVSRFDRKQEEENYTRFLR